jgi:hypothetical protein
MTPEEEAKIDWSLCTWKGSRRSQHQDFYSLSFRRKMEVIEEMNEFAQASRRMQRIVLQLRAMCAY